MITSYQQKGSLELAYLGDAVYELLVREMLSERPSKPGKMHQTALRYVACHGQAVAAEALMPTLTPEEADILRRGRNSHLHPARHNDPGEYALATGLEALFGYLHLKGDRDRLRELFKAAVIAIEEKEK